MMCGDILFRGYLQGISCGHDARELIGARRDGVSQCVGHRLGIVQLATECDHLRLGLLDIGYDLPLPPCSWCELYHVVDKVCTANPAQVRFGAHGLTGTKVGDLCRRYQCRGLG